MKRGTNISLYSTWHNSSETTKKKANLRCQWQRITDRVKSGSELAPVREAEWFARLNEIFTETKKEEDCNGTVMVN